MELTRHYYEIDTKWTQNRHAMDNYAPENGAARADHYMISHLYSPSPITPTGKCLLPPLLKILGVLARKNINPHIPDIQYIYMVTTICLHYTLFRDRTFPNVAQNPKGTNVSVFCGADIAHLPTPKFALGPLDSRPEGNRTNFERERERERGRGRGRGIAAPYTILESLLFRCNSA